MTKSRITPSPFLVPILFFGLTIICGTLMLHSPISLGSHPIAWIDALFTATSALCVTGLVVVDTGSFFSSWGQTVILVLIQLGGLGIMTFTSLAFYLWRQRVSLVDRIAVGQSLLHDPTFQLGRFLIRIVVWTLSIEILGAGLIYLHSGGAFSPYSALFHAVSAFCNAGFSLYRDSLIAWRGDTGINLIFMMLIILGGIGFSVMVEISVYSLNRIRHGSGPGPISRLSWYAKTVVKTTLFLILAGWAVIYLAEIVGLHREATFKEGLLVTLFQSVTCRTAGFNTVDIGALTNVSLFLMIMLMFIGGAPGSCAGGVKVTTFRALVGFIGSQLKGRRQTRIGKFALDSKTLNNTLILIVFAGVLIVCAALLLNVTEGGDIPHPQARDLFLEVLFEAVSAFGTVGLSMGLTPRLTLAGKSIIILLMFIGRLGPMLFLAAIQSYQKEELYTWPEESMLIG